MKDVKVIGRVEKVSFPKRGIFDIPSRIDTGAKTSSVWASEIKLRQDGKLSFYLFDSKTFHSKRQKVVTRTYTETVVSSSMGTLEKRYKVRLLLKIRGKLIRGSFTLANRSQQVYPILIGRNILRGKFIVDVKKGKALYDAEKRRTKQLRSSVSLANER